jgi:hypothetical protein
VSASSSRPDGSSRGMAYISGTRVTNADVRPGHLPKHLRHREADNASANDGGFVAGHSGSHLTDCTSAIFAGSMAGKIVL